MSDKRYLSFAPGFSFDRQKACKKGEGRHGGTVPFATAECYLPLLALAENSLDIKVTALLPIPILPLLLIPLIQSLDSRQGHE